MPDIKLELKRNLSASPKQVFAAWTRADALKEWFAPGPMTTPTAEVDARVGGRYRITMQEPEGKQHIVSGTFEEIVPDERIVFTWQWEEPGANETRVTITLRPAGAGTELTLLHERFTAQEYRDKHEHGWIGCLEKLPGFLARTQK